MSRRQKWLLLWGLLPFGVATLVGMTVQSNLSVFCTSLVGSAGTVLTLFPGLVLAANMLNALSKRTRSDLSAAETDFVDELGKALEHRVLRPAFWHYYTLVAGVGLIVAHAVLSAWSSFPR
jgi:hypothetical protein